VARPSLHARLPSAISSSRRRREDARNRAELSTPEAWRSTSQPPTQVEPFDDDSGGSQQLGRRDHGWLDQLKLHRVRRDESNSEWSSVGFSVLEIVHDLQSRKLPLGYGSRSSAESERFAFGTHRQTGTGECAENNMSFTPGALQLQRLVSRMSWHAAGRDPEAAVRVLLREHLRDVPGRRCRHAQRR
jgi:hypothetical protein